MPSRDAKFYSLILIFTDIIALMLAFTIAYIVRVQNDPRPLLVPVYAETYITSFVSLLPFWIIVFASLGLYSSIVYSRRLVEWSRIAIGSFVGILLVIGWEYITEVRVFPARLVTVYALIGSFVLLVLVREILRFTRGVLFRFGKGTSRVLIVGNSAATHDIAKELSDTQKSGFRVVAIAGPKRLVPDGLKVAHYSTIEAALRDIKRLHVTTII